MTERRRVWFPSEPPAMDGLMEWCEQNVEASLREAAKNGFFGVSDRGEDETLVVSFSPLELGIDDDDLVAKIPLAELLKFGAEQADDVDEYIAALVEVVVELRQAHP